MSEPPAEVTEELVEALDADHRLMLGLIDSFNRLVALAEETGRRHHELYRSWMAALDGPNDRTGASSSFIPRIVKK